MTCGMIYQHATKRGERAIGDFLGGLIERRQVDDEVASEGGTDVDGARGGTTGHDPERDGPRADRHGCG
jgi:hypothetical protein